ncbi:hypothetical protein NDU88_002818 [Pleurodeles waltl]|uniref:Uncharacterized protein n=1 Tax=Pleurodeles waltl TaxID=8319 RepID=A0AAV7SFG3_PLEWA|nr:hypothetical protein NDU88_002818 [Pleurodeles waltl]
MSMTQSGCSSAGIHNLNTGVSPVKLSICTYQPNIYTKFTFLKDTGSAFFSSNEGFMGLAPPLSPKVAVNLSCRASRQPTSTTPAESSMQPLGQGRLLCLLQQMGPLPMYQLAPEAKQGEELRAEEGAHLYAKFQVRSSQADLTEPFTGEATDKHQAQPVRATSPLQLQQRLRKNPTFHVGRCATKPRC